MTSSNFVLTLTLLAVTSCLVLGKPMSPDSQQFLSLLSTRYLPRLQNSPSAKFTSREQTNHDDAFNANTDDVSSTNNMADSVDAPFPVFPLIRSSTTRDEAKFLRDLPVYSLEDAGLWQDGAALSMGRGKRYIPGLNALYMAGLLGTEASNARYMEGSKRKRQPHLGFHASRG